jgi:hypothetical protein
MSKCTYFTKLKHLIFPNRGSSRHQQFQKQKYPVRHTLAVSLCQSKKRPHLACTPTAVCPSRHRWRRRGASLFRLRQHYLCGCVTSVWAWTVARSASFHVYAGAPPPPHHRRRCRYGRARRRASRRLASNTRGQGRHTPRARPHDHDTLCMDGPLFCDSGCTTIDMQILFSVISDKTKDILA